MPSYRGIVLDSIHPNIKAALDTETAGFTREDGRSYEHITTRTPWMRSVPFTVPTDPDNELVPKWQDWVLYSMQGSSGVFGRAGLSNDNTGLYRSNKRNTPVPGVTSINVSNKGDLGTLRRATLNIKCYHETDLLDLEMMYMVPGTSILLEWGWYSNIKSKSPIPLNELDEGGKFSTITTIQEELLKRTLDIESLLVQYGDEITDDTYAGLYDGLVGVVTKFNWSNASDGTYDVTIDIIAPNSLTLGVPTNTYSLGANIVDADTGDKTPVIDIEAIYYKINTQSSRIISEQTKQAIQENITDASVDTLSEFSDESDVFQMVSSGPLSINSSDLASSLGFVEFYVENGGLKAKIVDKDPEQSLNDEDLGTTTTEAEDKREILGYTKLGTPIVKMVKSEPIKTHLGRATIIRDKDGKSLFNVDNIATPGLTAQETLKSIIEAAINERKSSLIETIDIKQESEIDFANSISYNLQGDNFLSWKQVKFELLNNKEKIPVMTCDQGIGTTIPRGREKSFLAEHNEMGISVYGETYVSWRFIEEYIINELFMPRLEDNSLVIKFMSMHPLPITDNQEDPQEEDVKYESVKIINNKLLRSLDPGVCILPGQETTVVVGNEESMALPGSQPLQDIANKFNTDLTYTEGYLRNILVNINIVREAAEEADSVNDFALEILTQVSEACGNPWNFKVVTNTALQQVMIIDENHKGDYKGYKDNQDSRGAYKFSGIGTNNICRDVKISSKLPSEIQALAYYAASGQSSSKKSNMNMFKLYGQGLRDRLKPNLKVETESNKQREEQVQNEAANTWLRYSELVERTRLDIAQGIEKSKSYREGIKAAENFTKIFIFDSSEENPAYSPPIPIDISLTLNGISGIYMGNAIMLDTISDGGLLPDRYKGIVALQATSVDQSISSDGWTTSVNTLMRPIATLDAPKVPISRPAATIPAQAITEAIKEKDKEEVNPNLSQFAQYMTETGIPYINGVAQPSQKFYKMRGSDSKGLFATQDNGYEYFAEIMFESWVAMTKEASGAGIKLQVNDSWRSNEKQAYLYQGRKDYLARNKTGPVFHPAGRPGYSKHQSGVGIDINTYPHPSFKWCVNNAHRFGFKRNVKGESWHWVFAPNQDIYGQVPPDHESWRGEEAIV